MDIEGVCKEIGKQPKAAYWAYANGEDFEISHAVEQLATSHGFHIGSLCCDAPRALSRTRPRIAKWWNIGREDYPKLDGVMLCDDYRNGTVAVIVVF